MAPKAKHAKPSSSTAKTSSAPKALRTFHGRDGLGAYLEKPESLSRDRVVYYNEDFVVINDLFPKASVHLLIIPRKAEIYDLDPMIALNNETTLAAIHKEVMRTKELVASELKRRFGRESTSSQAYNAAVDKSFATDEPPSPSTLPKGRDWSLDVRAGIHVHPSMSHLHVHVISRDMHSSCLKHRKHYNSFNTDFFVRMDEFPMPEDHVKVRETKRYLDQNMKCWRCGDVFPAKKFAQLKKHLDEEFASWKQE